VFEPFHYAFVQRGLVEALLLSIPAGILGTWIVLRGLAFFSHAVGTAAFPGLVVAAGLGWPAPAGAALAATAYTFGVEGLASRRESDRETLTGLTLVGALALGVILASDVFHSGANVETLLFGSLLVIGTRELVLAAVMSLLVVAATVVLGRRWVATGFDPASAPALGLRSPLPEGLLVAAVALGAIACVSALGALSAGGHLLLPERASGNGGAVESIVSPIFVLYAHHWMDDTADQSAEQCRRRSKVAVIVWQLRGRHLPAAKEVQRTIGLDNRGSEAFEGGGHGGEARLTEELQAIEAPAAVEAMHHNLSGLEVPGGGVRALACSGTGRHAGGEGGRATGWPWAAKMFSRLRKRSWAARVSAARGRLRGRPRLRG